MSDEGYAGSATVSADGAEVSVEVRLSGRIEPMDGRYHWAGRIVPQEAVTRLFDAGVRSAALRIGDGRPVQARLSEMDPWGAVRVSGVSAPPWPSLREVE
jgi:Domain of unknown function (DUF4873)